MKRKKKRLEPCSVTIKCPPWMFAVSVSWGDRGKAVYLRDIKRQGATGADTQVDDNTTNGTTWGTHIWLEDVSPSTLVHELHHATSNAMDHMGVDDEECEAYLQTWLYRRIMAKWGMEE